MPSNVGVFDNDGGLRADVTTVADVFKKAGYRAVWMGKTNWGGDARFDSYRRKTAEKESDRRRAGFKTPKSRQPEDATVAPWPATAEDDTVTKETALRFLERNKDRRFFAGVSFDKPHFPFVVQEEYYRLYKDALDVPRVTRQMLNELPLVLQRERKKYGFARLTDQQIRKARAIYYGMVTYIDDQIGDILRKVDELGLRDKTIILYTADHGELAGEHGLWYKNSFYEAAVRIPLICSFPKMIPEGVKVSALAMNMDIFPTLCDLCGLPKPAGLEGKSLVPAMQGKDNGRDRFALSENFRAGTPSRMIRTRQWKYCYFHKDKEQLFDLENDPEETVNLVKKPEHKDVVASLRSQALQGWRMQEFFEWRKRGRRARAEEP